MDKYILISDQKWERDYKPVREDNQIRFFYTSDEVEEYLISKDYDVYNVWTAVDGDDGVSMETNGWNWCNSFGYYVTDVKWNEGEDINTFSGDAYLCKIEQIHEDIECMDICIKKGKDLDYYGNNKEEQDEMKQMFLDDIKYCEEEIKNYNLLLKEELIKE